MAARDRVFEPHRVEHRHGPLTRFARSYGTEDPANLAHRGRVGLIEGITAVLAGVRVLLRPGGIAVVTARPWRRDRFLVDLPGDVAAAGAAAGLKLVDHRYALLTGYRDGRFIPRHSFFQLTVARESRRKGRPVHLPAFEHVLVFTRPATCASSGIPHHGAGRVAMSRPTRGGRPTVPAQYERLPAPATTGGVSWGTRLLTGRNCSKLPSTTRGETDTNRAASRVILPPPKPDELRRVVERTHSFGFLAPAGVPT